MKTKKLLSKTWEWLIVTEKVLTYIFFTGLLIVLAASLPSLIPEMWRQLICAIQTADWLYVPDVGAVVMQAVLFCVIIFVALMLALTIVLLAILGISSCMEWFKNKKTLS